MNLETVSTAGWDRTPGQVLHILTGFLYRSYGLSETESPNTFISVRRPVQAILVIDSKTVYKSIENRNKKFLQVCGQGRHVTKR